jgi:hypothetical protein
MPGFGRIRYFPHVPIFVATEEEFIIRSYGATDQVIGKPQMSVNVEANLLTISTSR